MGTTDMQNKKADKTNFLLEGERFDDLQLNGLEIIQHKDGYCFTSDSVLLSSFSRIGKNDTVVEFCAGSAVISILLKAKNPTLKKIYAIEIQQRLAEMAKRSVVFNNLQESIEILNISVQDTIKKFKQNIDVIVCNPPYAKRGSSILSNSSEIDIARSEELLTMQEIIKTAHGILEFGGRLNIMYPIERSAELFFELKSNKLEPKKVMLVQAKPSKSPHLILVEAVKGGKSGLKWINNLIIFDDNNKYTEEAKKIYNID